MTTRARAKRAGRLRPALNAISTRLRGRWRLIGSVTLVGIGCLVALEGIRQIYAPAAYLAAGAALVAVGLLAIDIPRPKR
jgi:hypothetical protein